VREGRAEAPRLAVVMRTMKRISCITVVIVVASQVISEEGQKHRRVVRVRIPSPSSTFSFFSPSTSSGAERRPTQQGPFSVGPSAIH